MMPKAVRNRRRQRPLLEVPTTPLAAPVPCQETRRLGCNEVYLRTGQHGLRLVKRQADLLELVIALVEAGNHVLAEHGFIIADDPELDLNSHGHSEGSMADKLQPTCLPQRRPRHPTDFYALGGDLLPEDHHLHRRPARPPERCLRDGPPTGTGRG